MKFLKIELATLICHIGDFFNEKYWFFQKLKKKEKEERKSGNAWEKKINESYFLSPFKLSKILLINNSVFLIWQQDVSFLIFFSGIIFMQLFLPIVLYSGKFVGFRTSFTCHSSGSHLYKCKRLQSKLFSFSIPLVVNCFNSWIIPAATYKILFFF